MYSKWYKVCWFVLFYLFSACRTFMNRVNKNVFFGYCSLLVIRETPLAGCGRRGGPRGALGELWGPGHAPRDARMTEPRRVVRRVSGVARGMLTWALGLPRGTKGYICLEGA